MFVIFLAIIIVGLLLFGWTFSREIKGELALDDRLHLGGSLPSGKFRGQESPIQKVKAPAVRDQVTVPAASDEKSARLEKMIEEKNKVLLDLEADLKNEQSQRGEFDRIKSLLQQQIEEHKIQNRKLKDELARALQDNLDLQTRAFNLEHGIKDDNTEEEAADVVRAEPDISGASESFDKGIRKDDAECVDFAKPAGMPSQEQDSPLGLYDIFDENKDKEKQENGGS